MSKYIQYIKEFQEGNPHGMYFVNNQLKDHLKGNAENQAEIEHILDYVYSCKKTFKSLGYKTIKEKADAWSRRLQAKASTKNTEKEGVDYETVFKVRTYRFVKLLSKSAYAREGKLMSHCVSSYYGRDDEIYSLRDAKNRPHCTISKSSGQVKGKGNGHIHPKYIEYVIEFLRHFGMTPSDGDMKNLGYVDVSSINDIDFPEKWMWGERWFFKDAIKEIDDKDDVRLIGINGGWFDSDFNEVINLERAIEKQQKRKGILHRDSSVNSGLDSSVNSGRYRSVNSGLDSSVNSGLDSSVNSGRDSSVNSGRDWSVNSGRDWSVNSGLDRSVNSGLDRSVNSGRDRSVNSGRDRSVNSGLDRSVNSGGKDSMVTGRHNSRAKGGLRSVITLCNCNDMGEIVEYGCIQVDGKKYKVDTWYCLKDGKIVEWRG